MLNTKYSRGCTYRNVGLAHATATVNVILGNDAVAIMETLPTLKSPRRRISSIKHVCRMFRVENVDALACQFLGILVWIEDLDGVVDTGNSHSRLVRVACGGMLEESS